MAIRGPIDRALASWASGGRCGRACRDRFDVPGDSPKRIQLRRPRRPLTTRCVLPPQCSADGVAVMAGAPGDLMDREPPDLLHPPDLRPAPHVQYAFLLASHKDMARVSFAPDETDYLSDGGEFNLQPTRARDVGRRPRTGRRPACSIASSRLRVASAVTPDLDGPAAF